MRLVRGNKLNQAQREDVLRSFVHRHLDTTCKTDDEWLERHAFYIRDDGRLAKMRRAEPYYLADDHGDDERRAARGK